MSKRVKLVLLATILVLAIPVYTAIALPFAFISYLPLVSKYVPPTATPTFAPLPTPPPPIHTTGNVVILHIAYFGTGEGEADENVDIRNDEAYPIQLANWTLNDSSGVHQFTFPSFIILPGQVCKIYTNENHPEWCGFNFGSESPIWDNTCGDCAFLRNSSNQLTDQYCYVW